MDNKQLLSEEMVKSPKNKNLWIILFLVGIILLFIIGYKFLWLSRSVVESNSVQKQAIINRPEKLAVDPAELNRKYIVFLDEVRGEYEVASIQNTPEDWLKFSYSALDKAFNTVITAENKDLHLKLTISLNLINKLASLEDKEKELNDEVEKLRIILEL